MNSASREFSGSPRKASAAWCAAFRPPHAAVVLRLEDARRPVQHEKAHHCEGQKRAGAASKRAHTAAPKRGRGGGNVHLFHRGNRSRRRVRRYEVFRIAFLFHRLPRSIVPNSRTSLSRKGRPWSPLLKRIPHLRRADQGLPLRRTTFEVALLRIRTGRTSDPRERRPCRKPRR